MILFNSVNAPFNRLSTKVALLESTAAIIAALVTA